MHRMKWLSHFNNRAIKPLAPRSWSMKTEETVILAFRELRPPSPVLPLALGSYVYPN